MAVAFYADYIADLRAVFTELDRSPERFQTFDAHFELTAGGSVIVYETRRQKGQTDSLYYGQAASSGVRQQVSQATAFAAIDRFFGLGQFVALAGDGTAAKIDVDQRYPHCAVKFSYRKKGQPAGRSMLMVFIGFNDEADALHYVATTGLADDLVGERGHRSAKAHEWK